MKKKYYLVETDTFFYDPHGTPDYGGVSKAVILGDYASGVSENGTYISADSYSMYLDKKDIENDIEVDYFLKPEDWEKVVEPAAMDGYNWKEEVFTFREISENEYHRYALIINDYKLL